MKPFLLITGMHRSGTSFLVRALNLAGVNIGEIEELTSNDWEFFDDNLRGHWEHKEFHDISEKTLELNKGSWDNPPQNTVITAEIGKLVKGLSEKLVEKPAIAAGFKDPRLLICLDSWNEYLPKNSVIIGIFRHPLKVAESLKKRNNFSYEKSLQLWKIYNQKLLDFLEKNDGFLIDFDWPKTKLLSELEELLEKLGIPKFDFSEWYTEELLHSDKKYDSVYPIPNEIKILYSRLKERSLNNHKIMLKIDIKTSQELLKILNSSLHDLQQQGLYFKKLNKHKLDKVNLILRDRDSKIFKLDSKILKENSEIMNLEYKNVKLKSNIVKLESKILKLEPEIDNYRRSLTAYQKQILEIHQSFVFRMLRKFDNSIGKYLLIKPKKYTTFSYPPQTKNEYEQMVNKALINISLLKKDIVCFPIINWDYRVQRPHHLMTEFVNNGHRIFYLTTTLKKLESEYEIHELEENIYQIQLSFPRFFDIHKDTFNENDISSIIRIFRKFRKDVKLNAINFVQFPSWAPLVTELRNKFGYKIIFDFLDDFSHFNNISKLRIEKDEEYLKTNSDLVLASSSHIFEKNLKNVTKKIFLPNAGEFSHFVKSDKNLLAGIKKPIIGYFGAIAEWFDIELIKYLAKQRPYYTFVLIGHTYGSDIRNLEKFENVIFLGERPYFELPNYLHGFDVCIIPFKITPLTEATHPVKIYEYFAAGKPVVSTKLGELQPMSSLCYIAETKEDFLSKIEKALSEKDNELKKKRIQFSSENTWNHRFNTLQTKLLDLKSLNLHHHN